MRTLHAIIIVATLAVLLRCGDDESRPDTMTLPPQKPELLHAKGPDDSNDRNNLLNFAHGAVVVSRTGEVSLQNSAENAIDGDPITAWLSPPDEPDQSLVFALPARAKVHAFGLHVGEEPYVHPKSVSFDVSSDAKTFATVATFDVPASGDNTVDVPPVDARYVRFNTHGGAQFVRAISIYARGDLVEPVRPGSLDGCWSINGADASFTQRGAEVTGVVAGESPVSMDGGSDGRFYRFLWLRGPEYGVAGVSVTSDGQHLSGIFWHEEAYNRFIEAAWFGDKKPCGAPLASANLDVMAASMQRNGRYVLYGIQFDDSGHVIAAASQAALDRLASYLRTNWNVQIVAHELLQPDKARNQIVSQSKIDSLRAALEQRKVDLARIQFAAVGSDNPHRPASTDAARSVYGSVELLRR